MPIPVSDRIIAKATIEQLYDAWVNDEGGESLAEFMLTAASKFRFQPSTRQLVLTFDLAMGPDGTE